MRWKAIPEAKFAWRKNATVSASSKPSPSKLVGARVVPRRLARNCSYWRTVRWTTSLWLWRVNRAKRRVCRNSSSNGSSRSMCCHRAWQMVKPAQTKSPTSTQAANARSINGRLAASGRRQWLMLPPCRNSSWARSF